MTHASSPRSAVAHRGPHGIKSYVGAGAMQSRWGMAPPTQGSFQWEPMCNCRVWGSAMRIHQSWRPPMQQSLVWGPLCATVVRGGAPCVVELHGTPPCSAIARGGPHGNNPFVWGGAMLLPRRMAPLHATVVCMGAPMCNRRGWGARCVVESHSTPSHSVVAHGGPTQTTVAWGGAMLLKRLMAPPRGFGHYGGVPCPSRFLWGTRNNLQRRYIGECHMNLESRGALPCNFEHCVAARHACAVCMSLRHAFFRVDNFFASRWLLNQYPNLYMVPLEFSSFL